MRSAAINGEGAIERLHKQGYSQREIAKALGLSQSTAKRQLQARKVSPRAHSIPDKHKAEAIASIWDDLREEEQEELAEIVSSPGFTERETYELVRELKLRRSDPSEPVQSCSAPADLG